MLQAENQKIVINLQNKRNDVDINAKDHLIRVKNTYFERHF